jgi:DNA (cytosine-5)-methyltransferase 1
MPLSPLQRRLERGLEFRGVDEFSGLGGWTEAAAKTANDANPVSVIAAANHWPLAVQVHSANHPGVQHICQDLRQFDFSQLPQFEVLLASPSCQGHSRAGRAGRRSSKSVAKTHDELRATAWAVVDCLEVCRPLLAIIENVVEFSDWVLMPAWLMAIERLGYSVTKQVVLASRWDTPQRRYRVIYIAHLEGPPLRIQDPNVPERGLQGIFDRSAGGWKNISSMKPRSTKNNSPHLTAREKAEFCDQRRQGQLGWGQHTNYGRWGLPTSEPAPTLTTVAGLMFWTKSGRYRQWTDDELKMTQSFPKDYSLCGVTRKDAAKLIGNAVPPEMGRGIIRATLDAARALR